MVINMFLSQIPEVDETIRIALRDPSADSRIGQDSVAYLTILKNDDAIYFAGFMDYLTCEILEILIINIWGT